MCISCDVVQVFKYTVQQLSIHCSNFSTTMSTREFRQDRDNAVGLDATFRLTLAEMDRQHLLKKLEVVLIEAARLRGERDAAYREIDRLIRRNRRLDKHKRSPDSWTEVVKVENPDQPDYPVFVPLKPEVPPSSVHSATTDAEDEYESLPCWVNKRMKFSSFS